MEDAYTLVSKETLRDWRKRGGSHWVSCLATWSSQNPSLSVVGTVPLRRERQPRPATRRRYCGWQATSKAAVVRCKLAASQTESAGFDGGGLELVVIEPHIVDDELNELLTYFLRCMCNAGEDRECLNAHVDRELLELGDTNHIILSHVLSSHPRVAERKTSHSQSPHGCPRRASHRSFAIHQAPIA